MSTTTIELATRVPKPARTFAADIERVKPLFATWLKADEAFERNTQAVAIAVSHSFGLFKKENPNGTRVAFARYFDSKIPETATTRDLGDNATYNRLNYLLDKIANPNRGATDRVSVIDRRKKMHADWLQWRRQHARKTITMDDVEDLVKSLLAELWPEETVVEEVITT